jgi:hypothetical protein
VKRPTQQYRLKPVVPGIWRLQCNQKDVYCQHNSGADEKCQSDCAAFEIPKTLLNHVQLWCTTGSARIIKLDDVEGEAR